MRGVIRRRRKNALDAKKKAAPVEQSRDFIANVHSIRLLHRPKKLDMSFNNQTGSLSLPTGTAQGAKYPDANTEEAAPLSFSSPSPASTSASIDNVSRQFKSS